MTITYYYIPEIQEHKPISLKFTSKNQRDNFFAGIALQTTTDYAGYFWDPYKLVNTLPIKDENGAFLHFDLAKYNYAKVNFAKNDNHNVAGYDLYYYIVDLEQKSKSLYQYLVKLDTFMSYMSVDNQGISLSFKPSLVVREHKARFDFIGNKVLYNHFLENNNNTTPKIKKVEVVDPKPRVRLVYRNRTIDWKPVAYIYVENENVSIPFTGQEWTGMITSSQRAYPRETYAWDGDYNYTLNDGETPNISVTDDWNTYYHGAVWNATQQWLTIYRYNKSTGARHSGVGISTPTGQTSIKIRLGNRPSANLYQVEQPEPGSIPYGLKWSDIQINYFAINSYGSGTEILPTFNDIDPYDAKNQKVIELPYLNFDKYYKDEYGVYVKLEEHSVLEDDLDFNINLEVDYFDTSKDDINRVLYNDPKLFTSQFAPVFAILNGSVYGIRREWIDKSTGILNYPKHTIGFKFHVDIATPSLFNIEYLPGLGGNIVDHDVDERIKRFTVNNEVITIKDDAYTYNEYYRDLDDRSRKIAEDASQRNLTLNALKQIVGTIGQAASPINPFNDSGVLAFRAESRATRVATGVLNTALSIYQGVKEHQDFLAQNKIKYETKYLGLQMTVAQISGSSIDFLHSFDGDKLRIIQMGLTDYELDYWDLYFHKFGYQTLEYKIPVLKTRKYFDYKQIIIDEFQTTQKLKKDVINDLRDRFAKGITIYHVQSDLSVDWKQEKENWEI